MSPRPGAREEVRDAAREDVTVSGEELIISKAALWRNDMPSFRDFGFGAGAGPANVAVTIHRRSSGATQPDGLESSVLPYIVALHVIRVNQDPPATPTTEDFPPDSPISSHFAWAAPPTLFSKTDDVAMAAKEGGFFVSASAEKGDALELSAWHGPRWGSLRNGLDDMIDYVAVVEFEEGVFLKSKRQRLQIVH
ncbi:hypothetical protein DENSPDRAFT_857649 [Dentipellis sp. KUC8613]|nr:hypothetical protein DENSPDRAFT_857649 [Dentipellis sp. KUC8613]